eukprot:6910344-Ditylum_brightwellii.AAC.1
MKEAWVVWILYCLCLQAYTSTHNPIFSMCDSNSPGWRLINNSNSYLMVHQQLLLGKDFYASLEILDQ